MHCSARSLLHEMGLAPTGFSSILTRRGPYAREFVDECDNKKRG